MKGKDISVGLDVAFHPTSNSSSKYNKPYRGKVVKLVAKGDPIKINVRRTGGRVEERETTADEPLFEVEPTEECGSGSWSTVKVGKVLRLRSSHIWRPWDEEKTRAETKAAAQAREEQRRLSTWAGYDSVVADITADLDGTDIDLSAVWQRQEYNRSYRDAPTSVAVPVELLALLANLAPQVG